MTESTATTKASTNSLENGRFARIIFRIRPNLANLSGSAQIQAFVHTAIAVYLAPVVIISLIWLISATDFSRLITSWPSVVILFVAILFMNRRTFTLEVASEEGGLSFISSLSNLALWAGILITGSLILWIPLLVSIVLRVRAAYQLRTYNQDPVWEPVSQLSQDILSELFAPLVALLVYGFLGGQLPLSVPSAGAWGAAFVSMFVAAVLPGLIMLPTFSYMNRAADVQVSGFGLTRFLLQITALSLIMSPFAVLVALAFIQGGLWAFFFFIVGIVLVNMLAFHMSQTAEQSRQRTRELTHLEALSEAILQAPPDAASLPDILRNHLPRLYPHHFDLVEVHLFAENGDGWTVHHPANKFPLLEETWQALANAPDDYLILEDVVLPTMKAVYGDAVLVKIPEIVPGLETAVPTCIGGVYLLRHKQHADTQDSLPAVRALASQMGSALYRTKAHQEMLTSHKMTQELEFAGHIQASFLPKQIPQIAGWDITAAIIPARQTSGDFYDFIELDNGRLGLLVADVSDKGTGAALYMALSRTLLRTYAFQYPDNPEIVLKLSNERILADTETDQFVTLFYGVLNPETGQMIYANAGHNPSFVINNAQDKPLSLGQTGIPLGMFPDMDWQQETIQLASGDVLAMYTDGVPEAENSDKTEFGEAPMITAVLAHIDDTVTVMETAVIDAIHAFVADAPQFDDITLMIVKRL
ncbi:MAG: PP2C family protein-serine/threonine phosphatase [Anaerolineae bacterium]|nr:PP2C family protein-serine/threonine phosphatase [Anaerolineae bacterium]